MRYLGVSLGKAFALVKSVFHTAENTAYDVVNKKEVNYPTLMKDLNSCNLKTKFGIATLFSFISVTKNIAPLQYMAHERGYALIPLDQVMQTAEQNHDPIHAGVAKKQHSDYC